MKIVVSRYVYARVGAPSTDVSFSGYRSPGEALTVIDILPGTQIDGNAVWYRCEEDGCYYWSGGFEKTDDLLATRPDGKAYSHEELFTFYQSAANELGPKLATIVRGYSGIGAGYKVNESIGTIENQLVLLIYVEDKVHAADFLPGATISYRGLTLLTDVRQSTGIEFQQMDPDAQRPYRMGGRISEIDINGNEIGFGTRGFLVKHGDGTLLLTCFHVACASLFLKGAPFALRGKIRVRIPGMGRPPESKVLNGTVVKGGIGNNFDYALIAMDTSGEISELENAFPGRVFSNKYYELDELKLPVGTKFFKYGAASKGTEGTFKTYPANDRVLDKKRGIVMSGLIELTNMSKKGDSGAPVVDENNKILGIIVAGDIDNNSTYVVPFAQLKYDFHISPE